MIGTQPDAKTASISELSAWWAEHIDEIAATDSFLWNAKRRLREAIRDQGPLVTPVGKLSLGADKMQYAPETALEYPALGRHVVKVTVGTLAEAEQVIELTLEQIPMADVSHDLIVEARLATAFRKVASPEQAARLAELCTPAGRLTLS